MARTEDQRLYRTWGALARKCGVSERTIISWWNQYGEAMPVYRIGPRGQVVAPRDEFDAWWLQYQKHRRPRRAQHRRDVVMV